MKIFLVCLLGVVAGNAFATPIKLYCQFDGNNGGFEVEFDDNNISKMYMAGTPIPSTERDGNLKSEYSIDKISSHSIVWSKVSESTITDLYVTTIYSINRNTGGIQKERDSSASGTTKNNGICEKSENIIKKF